MPFNKEEKQERETVRLREKGHHFSKFSFLVTEDLHEGRNYKEMMGQGKEMSP